MSLSSFNFLKRMKKRVHVFTMGWKSSGDLQLKILKPQSIQKDDLDNGLKLMKP